MKFIHFADAHLDSPFRGLSFLPSTAFKDIYQATDHSLARIVNLALAEKVDLVLIAGDTFDSPQPSPRSQVFFAKEIGKLTAAHIQVVMIFGNHDYMARDDLLLEDGPYFKLLGPEEKIETAEFETKTGFPYQVTGFSYRHNHITEDKLAEFPAKGRNYSFALMHAQEKTTASHQNVYAPFSLAQMRALNYDYFALGHIHHRQLLSKDPLIVYPGNIQGRQIGEMGPKGCYLGRIDEKTRRTQIIFKETAPIRWQQVCLALTAKLSKSELRREILTKLADPKGTIYFSLLVTGAQFLTAEETQLLIDSDFWQSISQLLPHRSQLVAVRLQTNQKIALHSSDQHSFLQAEKETFTTAELKRIGAAWSKKDLLPEHWIEEPQFLQAVKERARVKLASKLKGINDASHKD